MHDAAPLLHGWPTAPHDAQAQALALAQHAQQTLAVARGLLDSGRRVDLTGLDRSIGLLCAKTLDLPPHQGRATRATLMGLAAELESLDQALRANPA